MVVEGQIRQMRYYRSDSSVGPASRLRQTSTVLLQSTQRDQSNMSRRSFVLARREDIVSLRLVLLPNLCLLLTELHRLTRTGSLCLGLL